MYILAHISTIKTKPMNRTHIINELIKKNNYTSYLEIGVEAGLNLAAIQVEDKLGVDPDTKSKANVFEPSDEFFSKAKLEGLKWDIIFIDGLHQAEQVERDITNALLCLKDGGVVLCHDMLPTTEAMQRVPREQDVWTGDCWKAFVKVRSERDDLEMFTIDTDWGVGFIRPAKNKQALLSLNSELNYRNFSMNAAVWMNIISPDQFISKEL